jgi:hypothetical protein
MKNLTENQQEIIDLIINEFELINEQKATETDDIFAYIDSAVNEKKLYAEEMKQRNELYESVIMEKINATHIRINNIVSRYGGECEIYSVSKSEGVICYSHFIIRIQTDKIADLYLYTNQYRKENILSYTDVDIKIYKKYRGEGDVINDANLEKYIADLVIRKLKSQIK